jgi:hypothetical protein
LTIGYDTKFQRHTTNILAVVHLKRSTKQLNIVALPMTLHRASTTKPEEISFTVVAHERSSSLRENVNGGRQQEREEELDAEDDDDDYETESVEARRKISILKERFDRDVTQTMTSPEEFERMQREIQTNYAVDLARARVSGLRLFRCFHPFY